MRTIIQLAKEAIDVQDACNLSGVVHSFSRVMTELRELLSKEEGFSTDKLNQHPICVMFSNKIAILCDSESAVKFNRAYEFCKEQGLFDNKSV